MYLFKFIAACMQATRSLEGIALGFTLITTVCLVFYVGTERSRTRGMAVAIMIIAFIAGKPVCTYIAHYENLPMDAIYRDFLSFKN